jgi:HTH-type transcriptional regulator/antitoxin MqsA
LPPRANWITFKLSHAFKEPMMKCPVCGGPGLVRDTRNLQYNYHGQTATIPDVTGEFCNACGEVTLDEAEARRYGEAVDAFVAYVDAAEGKRATARA